jgi:DNA-binding response OmpR family regulator
LSDEGYEVMVAYDGQQALASAARHPPDLIVLDIVMPELTGLQVCRRIRRDPTLAALPILFLTVRSTVEGRVTGLDQGGDDYLVKPFDTRELKARIRAMLRRSQLTPQPRRQRGRSDETLRVGQLALDLRTRRVCIDQGQPIQLTATQCDLMHHFMLHPDEVFPSRELLQCIWGYPQDSGNFGTVRWHVMKLREKIEPVPDDPSYIRTITGQGYMLAVESHSSRQSDSAKTCAL